MRMRDSFFVGVLIGLVWGLFRYPAALGCLVLLVFLFVILTVVTLFMLIEPWMWLLGIAALAGFLVFRRVRKTPPLPAGDLEE